MIQLIHKWNQCYAESCRAYRRNDKKLLNINQFVRVFVTHFNYKHAFLSCVDFFCNSLFFACSSWKFDIKLCQHINVVPKKMQSVTFFPWCRLLEFWRKLLSQLNDKNKQQKQELNIPYFCVGTRFFHLHKK